MIDANVEVISKDLDAHPEVIMEGIQSLLRAEGNIQGCANKSLRGTVAFSLMFSRYDDLMQFARETPIVTLDSIRRFVRARYFDSPNLARMLALTPQNYTPK